MGRKWLTCVLALGLLMACDEEDTTDAGIDGSVDDGGGTDAGPEPLALPGLDGDVEVIYDDRGMPHIYASTIHDLLYVEGYLMSQDRFIQMEFLRRNVVGRLAEALGAVSPGLEDGDADMRFLGFERTGQAMYDALPADDPTRLMVEAFVDGINHYIDSVILEPTYQPPRGLETFNFIKTSDAFGHWQPRDIFAIARFQAFSLSYDAGDDISRTEVLRAVRDAFDPMDGNDRIAARAGLFADFFSTMQARPIYTRDDGFNDGTTMAFLPDITRPILPPSEPRLRVPDQVLENGRRFFERLDRNPYLAMAHDEHIGSNSWVVAGTHTANGNPILSNDPHLSLISPAVWWYVHLNTERMGGEDMIDAQGVTFAGLPGVVLGYTRNLAWSATTTGYDVTDVYAEEITFRNDGDAVTPDWVPITVRYMGADVALETITEEIGVAGGDPVTLTIYDVPHHGPLIPDSLVAPSMVDPPTGALATSSGLSVRYTGHEVTNELAFFYELLTAQTVQEAFDAQDNFMVGIQNFSYADSAGSIGWSTHGRIPQRDCDFWLDALGRPIIDPSTELPNAPLFIMDGSGTNEWGADLGDELIPHDQNPARGYIATANQDNVGVTADGDPCNDLAYIGGAFAQGYRQHRIRERLDEMIAGGGGITTDDMIALQGETRSSLGEGMRDAIVASLEHAIGDTSDDAALDDLMASAGAEGVANLTEVRSRLDAWSLETPHGIGATDASENRRQRRDDDLQRDHHAPLAPRLRRRDRRARPRDAQPVHGADARVGARRRHHAAGDPSAHLPGELRRLHRLERHRGVGRPEHAGVRDARRARGQRGARRDRVARVRHRHGLGRLVLGPPPHRALRPDRPRRRGPGSRLHPAEQLDRVPGRLPPSRRLRRGRRRQLQPHQRRALQPRQRRLPAPGGRDDPGRSGPLQRPAGRPGGGPDGAAPRGRGRALAYEPAAAALLRARRRAGERGADAPLHAGELSARLSARGGGPGGGCRRPTRGRSRARARRSARGPAGRRSPARAPGRWQRRARAPSAGR